MIRRRLFVAVASLLLTGVASATAPSGWYFNVTIKYVYVGQVGNRVAVAITTPVQAGTCLATNEFTIDAANPHMARIYSLLVAAQLAGTTINIYANGDCSANGVVATDVSIGNLQPG
jgi:hypothetical protein